MSEQMKQIKRSRNNTQSFIMFVAFLVFVFSAVLSLVYVIKEEVFDLILPYALILIMAFLAILMVLILRFFKSVRLIDDQAIQLSQGNLNISDIMTDKTKGLEILTFAFNDMKRNLLSFIEATKSNVIILSDAVDKVTKSLDMSYKGNEQIAASIATVAEKAQEQLKIVKDTLKGIEDVTLGTERITATLANIEGFVENTVKITDEGSEHLDKYNEQMDVITTNLNETANFIETLNAHLAEIDQVGGLIISITEQLKLLSLNSAVEAARAGEAGKGFAVVSQEMNKLSAATRDSVAQINKLLSDIMSSNAKVSESIHNVSESFDISKTIFGSVKESFYTINKNANILNEDMKKVYEDALMINDNAKNISDHGKILHDASNEISSVTQDVASVTEEELAENEEINNQALSLQNMLSSIEALLRRYKTSVIPVKQVSPKRLKLVMMSPLDHPFWKTVRQGALYAQTELKTKNVDIEYIGFEKTDHRFNETLNQKIDEGCDGLILPGFVSDIDKCILRANQKGIPVMAFNCDFPAGTKRLSYFGPNVHAAGTTVGELLVKGIDGEGQVAIFRGDYTTTINQIRCSCVKKVLAKHKKIKIVTEIDDVITNDTVYEKMKELLNYYPDLSGVIIISGGAPGAAKAIEELGRVGKVKLICFDYDDEIIELIKKGIVYAAMGQDPFGQGHDPIIYMYNYLVANQIPEDITYTRSEAIDFRSLSES